MFHTIYLGGRRRGRSINSFFTVECIHYLSQIVIEPFQWITLWTCHWQLTTLDVLFFLSQLKLNANQNFVGIFAIYFRIGHNVRHFSSKKMKNKYFRDVPWHITEWTHTCSLQFKVKNSLRSLIVMKKEFLEVDQKPTFARHILRYLCVLSQDLDGVTIFIFR